MEEKNQMPEVETLEETENVEVREEKKSRSNMTSTRTGLTLRTIIGAAILYYAYSIARDIEQTAEDSRTMLYVFIVVFGIAGIWIIFDSVKRLIKKEYEK